MCDVAGVANRAAGAQYCFMSRRVVVTLLLVALVASNAVGQTRTVTGIVLDSVTELPLGGAVIYVDGDVAEHRADSRGRFTLNLSRDDTMLVVRRIGFVPRQIAVAEALYPGPDLGPIYLRPVATQLDRLAVEVDDLRLYPHMKDFYRRKQSGAQGTFITREEVVAAPVRRTSELLRRNGGGKIRVECPPFNWNGRGGTRADPCGARSGRPGGRGNFTIDYCETTVFVDGRQSGLKIDEIPLLTIAGVEIYPGPATTPTVFDGGGCGVLAIWTTGAR
jgi:hypothetical protein